MHQYNHPDNIEKVLTMIETPTYANNSSYLFSLNYTNANKTSPEFTTKYKSTEQLIEINFTILILRLHQERLSELLAIANEFQTKLDKTIKASNKDKDRVGSAGDPPPNTICPSGLATVAEEPDPTSEIAVVKGWSFITTFLVYYNIVRILKLQTSMQLQLLTASK